MEIDESSPATKFVTEPSSHLKCPVCKDLYKDPVINIKCGHTFCRTCAFASTHCPVDESHCDTSQLVVNRLVVGQIEDLQIYCQHGLTKDENGEWILQPDSCSQILSYAQRSEHEDDCPFALVPCPNSKKCGKLRRRDFDQHMKQCSQILCSSHKKGCQFNGTEAQVKEHFKTCTFKDGSSINGHLTQRLKENEELMQSLKSDNSKLVNRVTELERSNSQLVSQMEKQNNLIQNLQLRMEALSSKVDQIGNHVGSRRPMSASGSQLSLLDGGTSSILSNHQYRLGSVSSSSHTSSGQKYEKWEMPFQFKCIGTLRGHKDVVWSLTSKKGHLYSAGAEGMIKVWSLEQLAKGCVDNIKAHKGVVHSMATWGNTLISAGVDLCIRLWDLSTNEEKGIIKEAHENIICALAVHEDLLFTASFSVIKVWDLKTVSFKHSMTSANHWVRCLAINKNKDKLYSGSHKAIHVWDIKDKFDKLATIEHEGGSVYSLAITKQYIIAGNSGTYNQNLQLFNAETHEFVMNLCGHIGTVTTVVTSPSGRFMFSASQDNNIQMWSLEKLLPIQTLSRHQGSVNTLTLHGDYLLSGSEDHEIKVFRYFQIQ